MRAKKSLGQNFLKSKSVLNEIVAAADLKNTDVILEVGPGDGRLTEVLLHSGGRVIAVEKDDRLIPLLQEKFGEEIKEGRLELIHGDILELEPAEILTRQPGVLTGYKVVANIPYYITGAFLRKFLTADYQPSRMVLLLQKEVAKRIVAADGKESLLSLSVKCYGRPRYIKKVPARFFAPAPKVDSAILLIEAISRKFFIENGIGEEKFFAVLKTGFAHKRKFLISNLKEYSTKRDVRNPVSDISNKRLLDPVLNWSEIFQKCQISEKARAEDLSLKEWGRLNV